MIPTLLFVYEAAPERWCLAMNLKGSGCLLTGPETYPSEAAALAATTEVRVKYPRLDLSVLRADPHSGDPRSHWARFGEGIIS